MSQTMSLHEACYQGRLDVVRELLEAGADPNAPAPADPAREWISCAGSRPQPLNCVAIAWEVTADHVEIARLLIERGAVVDETVIEDHVLEMTLSEMDARLSTLLRANRQRRGLLDPARGPQ